MAEFVFRGATNTESIRLDRFLWFARLVKTRTRAQELVTEGRMRLNGRVVERAAAAARVGNILTFALHDDVRILRIDALPNRRGPAPEARACYTDLGTDNVSQEGAID
jgi:ribosome-associated heat shock protein Hsp15